MLCAYGDATTRLRKEASHTLVLKVAQADAIQAQCDGLENTAAKQLRAEAVAGDEQSVLYQIDMRYAGQGMKLTVDMEPDDFRRGGLTAVGRKFDDMHEKLFTFALEADHEGLRAVVQGAEKAYVGQNGRHAGADVSSARVDETRIFVEGEWHAAPIYDRDRLDHRDRIAGSAIATEMDSTCLILPGYVGVIDEVSNILIWPEGQENGG